MLKIPPKVKKMIEGNPVVLGTLFDGGDNPNLIVTLFTKVYNGRILITDVWMNQTVKDLAKNNNACLLVFSQELREGYKIMGKATYLTSGEEYDFIASLPENKGYGVKGVIVVQPSKIIQLTTKRLRDMGETPKVWEK